MLERKAQYRNYVGGLLGGAGYLTTFSSKDKGGEDDADDDEEDLDDEEDDEEDDGSGDPDKPNLDELLKDPIFKEQYEKRMKKTLSQRMKKYKDVDPKEYKRLKEKEKKRMEEEETDVQRLERELEEAKKQTTKVEIKEKRLAVKEFAIENGYDPKLVARLMESELDNVERDDDGDFIGIDESINNLAEEFPQIKRQASDSDDEDDDDEQTTKNRRYTAGDKKKKINKRQPKDPKSRGAQRALERHKKQENK